MMVDARKPMDGNGFTPIELLVGIANDLMRFGSLGSMFGALPVEERLVAISWGEIKVVDILLDNSALSWPTHCLTRGRAARASGPILMSSRKATAWASALFHPQPRGGVKFCLIGFPAGPASARTGRAARPIGAVEKNG